MKRSLSKIFNFPWYPLVLSAYPALALLNANTGEVQPAAVIRPLLVSVAFGGLLYFVFWLFFRKPHKAAFLTALWLALFFTFGHAYIYVDEKYPDAVYASWLILGWGILFALTLFWATRPKLTFASAASTLNTVALSLLIMSGSQVSFEDGTRSAHALGANNAPIQADLVAPANPPDVYYIILDMYTRQDLLKSAFDYDNTEFLNALRERGFYVADCSMSNYVRTEISLASSLNMTYLQELDSRFKPESTARRTLWNSLKHSAARYNFENMGYKTVNFATGFAWNELRDADIFIEPPPLTSGMSEFEGLFLRTTLGRYAIDFGLVDPDAVLGQLFRDRFNSVFDNMDDMANMPEPTFAYIHVISPHPPFVFDAEGNPTHPADFWDDQQKYPAKKFTEGYTNQLTWLNKKTLDAIDTLLAESDTPPIIILQGDHGPWMQTQERRMWILNAYYLPEHNDELYPTITPVNTFRLIFNAYFGGKYDILDDASYFSPVPKLYDFSEIQNTCGE
ncbi:MAG: hypothetical protein HY865_18310 [Chloroflexi bacterium]|nr:hypothetical protein [Chloroflexota bacterium]